MASLKGRIRQLSNALRYLARGDLSGLIRRLKWHQGEQAQARLHRRVVSGDGRGWGILCTPHTLFIANALSERLAKHGIASEVLTGKLKDFSHDFYIVLCPQMFKQLPPPDKRVVFQLEQSVSSRWFTADYLKILSDSIGVLDYSLENIDFLACKGVKYPKIHYLPIGAVEGTTGDRGASQYDFVFYGDNLSSERRRLFLARLQKQYKVKICNDVFGGEMYTIIRQAKAVINIHYYEGALLETPRLSECISLGVPVLSEGSHDQAEYPEFEGAVRFFEEGSVDGMMQAAAEMLGKIDTVHDSVGTAIAASAKRFNFMIDRFLVTLGAIPLSTLLDHPVHVMHRSDFFALSLPETIERRKVIAAALPHSCVLFDGVRHSLGWIGCGASFNALSRYVLADGRRRLTVMEDDAILPADFENVLREIHQYLDNRQTGWDILSGLMADINPAAKVLSVETVGGRTYVTLDKMTSMVFNIYNEHALQLLSEWNPSDEDAGSNTIDRYLERQNGLRVVVCLPFLVGYNEEAASTLWGFDNSRYTPMIQKAEQRIEAMARYWQLKNG
ncbi:methyltransferase type 11 [Brucella pituitosa]|uniref:Methyltransferase type 11 n=1 Tax=Brucella pituitosa TaxID=571256 RepID=A0ABS3K3H4_9HYPH|nr:methyltransferase type 11 [Brucella pituitosa]MBO1041467.1 methyltransferase type 11 [Brucella pituitosa]